MNKRTLTHLGLTSAAVLGVWLGASNTASANGLYLAEVNTAVTEAEGDPACTLSGIDGGCGLCHDSSDDQTLRESNEIVYSTIGGQDVPRNGGFFMALIAAGWDPGADINDNEGNAAQLAEVLDTLIADNTLDSDEDGITDFAEIAMGTNPLLSNEDGAVDDALCIVDGGSSSESGSGSDSGSGESTDTGGMDTGGMDTGGMDTGGMDTGTPMETGDEETSGGTAGLDDDDDGCSCTTGSDHRQGTALSLLALAFGLVARRRRRRAA